MKSSHDSGQDRKVQKGKNSPCIQLRDLKVKVSNEDYCSVFNTTAISMLGEGADFLLEKLDQLPFAIEHYSVRLANARCGYDPDKYFRLAQTVAILKKLEMPLFNESASERSFQKWLDAEASCH